MEFFATCSKGAERVLGAELRSVGVQGVRPLRSGVAFHGEVRDAYLALLWSRVAGRVLLTLGRVSARDADALYEGVKALPWHEHIASGKTIAVDARGVNDRLRNTQFTALRVKDAICDALVERRGGRPSVDTAHPDVRINVGLSREKATISIDLAGTPLDRRGYQVQAKPPVQPLRENLVATLLLMAGWGAQSAGDDAAAAEGAATTDPAAGAAEDALLYNPLCGGGSIAVEAALIARGIAPGILRSSWGFEGWAGHDEALWAQLLDDADARAQEHADGLVRVCATDVNPRALGYAQARAKRAGVLDCIRFEQVEHPFAIPQQLEEARLAACRLDGYSLAQLPPLYASLAAAIQDLGASTFGLITADANADAALGMQANEQATAINLGEEQALRVYDVASAAMTERTFIEVRGAQVAVQDKAAEQFAARLAKVAKQRRAWAAEHKVLAYRVYDADLPDYNLAIDIYHGAGACAGKTLVYVAEYAAPKQIDPAKTARRLSDALSIIPVVLEVDPACVFAKQRLRSKGGSQYAKDDAPKSRSERFVTAESGLLFEVNLSDYLDTGLFLDHRSTRQLLRALSKGKSFLNLFAYTGTASVYAAAGGAKFTTTVDMSNTYLDWARRNFELNGLLDKQQEFERADVLSWVREKRHSRERWDLVFVDPPTYSNSSKMGKRNWDVQRDHAELLISVSRLLTRTGAIVFSCNLRSFKPDVEKLAKAGVQMVDITSKTIPEDFERNQKIHKCYLLRRG